MINNYMDMYRSKQDKKFLEKMFQNYLSKKTNKFRRNLHINGEATDVSVIKVKGKFLENIGGYNDLPDKTVFQIHNKKHFNTVFFRSNVDIFETKYDGTIVGYHKEVIPNKKIKFSNESKFIWIVKSNLVNYLNIDPKNDSIGTK